MTVHDRRALTLALLLVAAILLAWLNPTVRGWIQDTADLFHVTKNYQQ